MVAVKHEIVHEEPGLEPQDVCPVKVCRWDLGGIIGAVVAHEPDAPNELYEQSGQRGMGVQDI